MTDEELMEQISDDLLQNIVTGQLFGALRACTDAGVNPQKAVRAIVAMFLEPLGPEVWKAVGLPQTTADRWRREAREVKAILNAEMPDEPSPEILEAYARLMTSTAHRVNEG